MYKRELEKNISQNTIAKSLFLYGVCEYQINHYGEMILNMWQNGVDEDILTFYFDAYEFTTIKQHLNQNSLFSDKNICVIKADKSIPKKELDTLVELCFKNENSFLLVQYFADDQKSKNMSKSFSKKKNADFVRFFKANISEATTILLNEAKKKNLSIEPFSLQYLYTMHHENLALAVNELEKLTILEDKISKADIDRLVFGLGSVNLEDFIVKLFGKKDIVDEFQTIIESGQYDHIFIITSIQNYISQLFAFNTYIKIHGSYNVKDILGYPLPDFIAQKRAKESMAFNLDSFYEILYILIDAEYSFKKDSFLEKNSFLLSTLLKIQQVL